MLMLFQYRGLEYALIYGAVVVFSICCHEYSHARTALWQGDDTAKLLGHLTLNPMKQMGWKSLVMLLFVGIAFGQVPVDRSKLRRPHGDGIVAFAGPCANFVLFYLFAFGLGIARVYSENSLAVQICQIGGMLNAVLFIFNMAPFPPLDGFGILCSFFPELRFRRGNELTNGITVFLLMMIFLCGHYLFDAARYLTEQVGGVSLQIVQPILGS